MSREPHAVELFDTFLLAGGSSRRMGSDKAVLSFAGATFLETIAAAARPFANSIAVVGRTDAPAGLAAMPDDRPGCGPLSGIESALKRTTTRAALVLACDLPLVTSSLLEILASESASSTDAIVIASDRDGRPSPLCGFYPAAACLVVTQLLDEGERMPRMLLQAYPSIVVTIDRYAHLPGAGDLLRNINTPDEYLRLDRDG